MHGSHLNIPASTRRTFKKHFLNSVHCELSVPGIDVARLVAARGQLAKDLEQIGFQYAREIHGGSLVLYTGQPGAPRLEQSDNLTGLAFSAENPKRQFNVTSDGMVLSDFGYLGFEDFHKRLSFATERVAGVLGLSSLSRIGLRKINAIRMESVSNLADALTAFNPSLFGALRSEALVQSAIKSAQEAVVLEHDQLLCVLRTALNATGIPESFEANLDFDVIDQHASDIGSALTSTLPKMNQYHFDLFMWAVTPNLINVMES